MNETNGQVALYQWVQYTNTLKECATYSSFSRRIGMDIASQSKSMPRLL